MNRSSRSSLRQSRANNELKKQQYEIEIKKALWMYAYCIIRIMCVCDILGLCMNRVRVFCVWRVWSDGWKNSYGNMCVCVFARALGINIFSLLLNIFSTAKFLLNTLIYSGFVYFLRIKCIFSIHHTTHTLPFVEVCHTCSAHRMAIKDMNACCSESNLFWSNRQCFPFRLMALIQPAFPVGLIAESDWIYIDHTGPRYSGRWSVY